MRACTAAAKQLVLVSMSILFVYVKTKQKLNGTLAVDSPFQILAVFIINVLIQVSK